MLKRKKTMPWKFSKSKPELWFSSQSLVGGRPLLPLEFPMPDPLQYPP